MKIKSNSVEVEITPELLAKAFWELDAASQADFFHHLGEEVEKTVEDQKNDKSFGYAGMQWLYMADATKERSQLARTTFLDLSAHAYNFWEHKYI